jgi:hypothetical protein
LKENSFIPNPSLTLYFLKGRGEQKTFSPLSLFLGKGTGDRVKKQEETN